MELFVFPWNQHSADINHYMKTFFTLPNDISLSSMIFTIFRWFHTIAAIIWLLITLLNMSKKSQNYDFNNNYKPKDLIALTVKSQMRSKNTILLENFILISMLILLVVMFLMCCWFEYFNPHLM